MLSILILLLIIGLVAGLGWSIFRQVNRKNPEEDMLLDAEWAGQREDAIRKRKMPYGLVAFGSKIRWIAVKATHRERVAVALGMSQIEMVNWHYGLQEAHKNHVFVTPPIKGWVLAVGRGLPDFDDGKNPKLTDLLSRLSQTFGEAHFFATHPAIDYNCWLKYADGELVRGLSAAEGSMLLNEGKQSGIEADLVYFDDTTDSDGLTFPDEQLVMEIAAEWSVNPTLLEKPEFEGVEGLGTLGYLRP